MNIICSMNLFLGYHVIFVDHMIESLLVSTYIHTNIPNDLGAVEKISHILYHVLSPKMLVDEAVHWCNGSTTQASTPMLGRLPSREVSSQTVLHSGFPSNQAWRHPCTRPDGWFGIPVIATQMNGPGPNVDTFHGLCMAVPPVNLYSGGTMLLASGSLLPSPSTVLFPLINHG